MYPRPPQVPHRESRGHPFLVLTGVPGKPLPFPSSDAEGGSPPTRPPARARPPDVCLPLPGDTIWAPSVLPHGTLGTLSHHPQLHFGRKMESKVSEGGLNVTLTIRLLMHGKVQGWERGGRHVHRRGLRFVLGFLNSKQSPTYKAAAVPSRLRFSQNLSRLSCTPAAPSPVP